MVNQEKGTMIADVKRQVMEYVLAGLGQPEAAAINESDLVRQFGLSRPNIREILSSLEGQGVIRNLPRKGYCYVDYNATDYYSLRLMRYTVEREALRKGVQRANQEDLRRIRLAFENLERDLEAQEWERFERDDEAFHAALIASSHDNMLIRMFDFIRSTVMRIHVRHDFSQAEFSEQVQQAHRPIMAAFEKRDWPALKAAVEFHLGRELEEEQ